MLPANLVLISFAVTLPFAQVFALPQYFALDADLWANAFGCFYRAWSVYAGGIAVIALLASLVLFIGRSSDLAVSRLTLAAVFAYAALAAMIFLAGAAEAIHGVALALSGLGWLILVSARLIGSRPRSLSVRADQP
ncbi:MAG: hypothetical protein V4441_12110 [Pseudomonadota bacterium]